MACGSCSKRSASRSATRGTDINDANKELFGEYRYLSNKQIETRLSTYKRKNCKDCEKRYVCDYTSFLICKKDGE